MGGGGQRQEIEGRIKRWSKEDHALGRVATFLWSRA